MPQRAQRVFVIGAGFSAGFGYPVGARLVPELVKRIAGLSPANGVRNTLRNRGSVEGSKRLLAAVDRMLQRFFATELGSTPTTEAIDSVFAAVQVAEFYTMAHTLADTPHLFGVRERGDDLDRLYGWLAAATRTYFTDISTDLAPEETPADMRSILDGIRPRHDAVVTFNWDEEVDFHLATQRGDSRDVAYTLAGRQTPSREFLLLKPHGSINWYDAGEGIANGNAYLVADADPRLERAAKRLVAYQDVELPRDFDGRPHPPLGCPPVVMPPTFAKRFTYAEQHLIWQDTLSVCSNAREFVFLGYSLPTDDFLTRAAIRSALRQASIAEVRCLCVGRAMEPALESAFRAVFGPGFSPERNFLGWEFGREQNLNFDALTARLAAATLEQA